MSTSEKTATATATATARVSTLLLPQDILVEILSKLPAISLVRFRCVSKFFCALVADHGFGVLHRSLSLTIPNRAAILISIIPLKPPPSACAYYTINFSEENPQRPGMLQANRLGYLDAEPFLKGCLHSSSDGLISLSRPNGDVIVCNVCTGQRISLPTIQSYIYLSCPHLGFDSQSKRYKVLMSTYTIDPGSRPMYKHWILTVGVDKSWREINCSYSYPFCSSYACPSYCYNISVNIDGVIYFYNWLTEPNYLTFHIVAFDVGYESYSLIPFPAELSSLQYYSASFTEKYHVLYGKYALLQVDGGRLAIVLVRQKGHQFYINVWTWEKSKEFWEKILMTISLGEDRTMTRVRYLRHTTNYAGEIVLLCRNSTQFFILVCNLKSEVWRKFDVGGIEEFSILYPMDVRMYKTMDNVFGG
ncbi:PREDICTED: F-box only protein 8-like [Ipomoea nil]|uniref:F-box only protein 8-like n=1 Tax=Ipomoea nil TaxID=35883 RepID=UPI000901885E|nr:PREDICTED: F-box only protein 8-like [Ipomoea nil]